MPGHGRRTLTLEVFSNSLNQPIIHQKEQSSTERGSSAAPIPQLSKSGAMALRDILRHSGFISAFELSGADGAGNLYRRVPAPEILKRLFILRETVTFDTIVLQKSFFHQAGSRKGEGVW